MKNRMWINLVMAVLVAGLFLMVSCAKTTVVSDPQPIQDQTQGQAGGDSGIQSDQLSDQAASEKALAQAKAMAAKQRFENQDIHFEYDSAMLSSMAKLILKEKAAWLMANSMVAITVEGHCDERGTTEYNLALGEKRAQAAKSYLVDLGISASRVSTISYGEEQPLDMGKTESAFRKNRRAHFVIN